MGHFLGRLSAVFLRGRCLCVLTVLLCGVTTVAGDDTRATAVSIAVNSSTGGSISPAGDMDYWRINAPSAGQLVVETTGSTDTIGVLEDSAGNQLEQHDDQDVNTNRNFKIERTVTAGTYYIRISAYRNVTGDYTLHVRHVRTENGSDENEPGNEATQYRNVNPSLGDFNGDGRDDVLLRHEDGRWFYYPMAGRRHIVSGRGVTDLTRNLDWHFAGIGDLNGDGKDDVLLRHEDGRWFYYPMDGRRHIVSGRGVTDLTRKLDWQFAGIGDLNGDGKDDVLLRHTDGRWFYYPMNGRRHIVSGRGVTDLTRNLDWQFAGIGDLNGDGKDDVLLRHDDGRWFYYPMNGKRHITSQRGLAGLTRNLAWQLAAIGDFNGDGKDDVLLRYDDGRWYYYPMDGRRPITSQRGLTDLTRNLAWQLAGIGDLNGDGRDDVLVRNEDGRWFYYPMDGRRHITSQRGLADLTRNLAWSISLTADGPAPPEQPVVVDDTPDLVVDAPSVSASTLTAEEEFTLRVTVRNRGTGQSNATTLRYYRSSDGTISATDTRVATNAVPALAASGSRGMSLILFAPTTAGTYYYGACVDTVSSENNTGNNCSSGVRVTVEEEAGADVPDLVVESPSVNSSTLIPSEAFTLSVTVRNQGGGRPGTTILRYYRSPNSTISSSDTQVSTDPVLGLSASDSSPQSETLIAPSSVGTYYYGACIDGASGESNTSNNCSSGVRVTVEDVPDVPDLEVEESPTAAIAVYTEAKFEVDVVVRNIGTEQSTATTLRYYRSTDSTIDRADTQVGTNAVPALAASDSRAMSIILLVPSTAGAWYYGACVDPVTGESNTENNCSIGMWVTVEEDARTGPPDLTVKSPSVSNSTLSPGETFTFSARVQNSGTGRSGSTTLRYYRSDNSSISTGDTQVSSDSVPGLSTSQISSERASLTSPSDIGTYYYGACVDTVSGESNTGNNCSDSVRVTVEEVPDARTIGDFPISVSSSCPTEISVCVRDHQCEDGDAVRVTVNNNVIFSGEIFNRWSCRTVPVREGRNSIEMYAINGTGFQGNCSYADANTGEIRITGRGGTVRTQQWRHRGGAGSRANLEINIGPSRDNCSFTANPPTPPTASDLVVESPSVSDSTLTAGYSFTFSVKVRNQGDRDSGSNRLVVYRSTDETINSRDMLVRGIRYLSVQLDASESYSYSVSIDPPFAVSTYYYGACIETDDFENYTGNNCSSGVRVTVEAGEPDLVVDSLSVSDSTLTFTETFTLSVSMHNRGNSPSSGDEFGLSIILSSDSTISRADEILFTDPLRRLSPGDSFTQLIPIEAHLTAGTYYIGACIKIVLGEINTDNNCSSGVRVTFSD